MSFRAFLEGVPLLKSHQVQIELSRQSSTHMHATLKIPTIELYCPQSECGGTRYFDPTNTSVEIYLFRDGTGTHLDDHFFDYWCRNCRRTFKTYALQVHIERFDQVGNLMKIGELPAFGEPRPNPVKDVLDDEIRYFERGYRAEFAGLGIGAFAYYRRFVESHKDKIIAEIRKVAVAQGATTGVLEALDKAAMMNSFESAVKMVKEAIPDSLRHSGGHNPLTLLHDALSAGLHNEDDAQCLEIAKDVRLLLTDLAERTTQALKDNSALGQAVNRLLKRATDRASAAKKPGDS
jgi:hypothetical protein